MIIKIYICDVLKFGFYCKEPLSDLDFIRNELLDLSEVIFYWNHVIDSFKYELGLGYIRYVKMKGVRAKGNFSVLSFDTNNRLIQDLLISFMEETIVRQVFEGKSVPFYQKFGKSLGEYEINSIYDFNAKTLVEQIKYYKDEHRDTKYYLRSFYIYIFKKQGDSCTLRPSDKICIDFILDPYFIDKYIEGYRYYPYNRLDDIPESDKMVTNPNGLESLSAVDKSYTLKSIDFTSIEDEKLRYAIKCWFWKGSKGSFAYRVNRITKFALFAEYRENLRKSHLNKFIAIRANDETLAKDTILAEEIVAYTTYLTSANTGETARDKIKSFADIFYYINYNGLYSVEKAVYTYLVGKSKRTNGKSEIEIISQEDSKKLFYELNKRSNKSLLAKQYYILFCVQMLTEIRISNILDLEIDCVVEKSRPGIYAVRLITKSNRDDYKDIQIKANVASLLKEVQEITDTIRKEAPTNVKKYLFLRNSIKNKYQVVSHRSYNDYLNSICNELQIPHISPKNIRKTYFTNLINGATEQNISLSKLAALTDHANFDTSDNFYVKKELQKYLETLYQCDLSIKEVAGIVRREYKEGSSKTIVDQGCGYCSNPTCTLVSTIPCFMCELGGFVTTPEHKKDFEAMIKIVDKEMELAADQHTRTHKYAVKQICLAYIYQIELLEKGIIND